jgi:hypothetical protein
VLGFDAGTLGLTAAFNDTPNGGEGGIWQSGGGPAVDGQGALYLSSGNGDFDTTLDAQGFPAGHDYGDSILKLVPDPASNPGQQNGNGWGLRVADYFTPSNESDLNQEDGDLGSGGVVLLPDSAGSAGHPHLLVEGGKQGNLYLVDRDNLGKFDPDADHVVQTVGTGYSVFDTPAYWNNTLYNIHVNDQAHAYPVSNGAIAPDPLSSSPEGFSYPGATPSLSASGATNGIVWALDRRADELRAYDATDLGRELYTSSQAAGDRDALDHGVTTFAVPTVANGRVYVGTDGALVGYGLFRGAPPVAWVRNAPLDNQGIATFQANVSVPSVASSGWFEIAGGARVRAAGTLADVRGGVLEGGGTLDANVSNAGQVIVGLVGSPGVLTITGNFTQTAGGDLYLEVGGTRPGVDYGQLLVGGAANLGGTLSVVLTNGYTPDSGTPFQLLTAGAVRGTFTRLDLDGTVFVPVYDPFDLTLVAR